jgi:hypothetical protein
MGNQTLVPSQIQNVESYFNDLKTHIKYKSSLGSTTFMKTAKVIFIGEYLSMTIVICHLSQHKRTVSITKFQDGIFLFEPRLKEKL